MDLKVLDLNGADCGNAQFSDVLFGREYNEDLIHQVVTAYLAAGRSGSRRQKNRSEVSGGGKKPWKQKGSGRARAGSSRSPIWRSGGVTFAARPQCYEQKINKKMYRAALSSVLSELNRVGRLAIVDRFDVDSPKTKVLAERIAKFGAVSVLIVTDDVSQNLFLAARNLPNVEVRFSLSADLPSLMAYDKVLMTLAAVKRLEGVVA